VALVLNGCATAYDPTTSLGKLGLLDQANLLLSAQNCHDTITLLQPVYNSKNTDNNIRMQMASAYACDAKINLFKNLGDLALNPTAMAGGQFWAFVASEFPSVAGDHVAEAAQLAEDALEAMVDPGTPLLPQNIFNSTTFNPGAYSIGYRLPNANAYLFFVSMAAIGALEGRYGNPFPNGKKGNALPWVTPTTVTADGCAYGSAIVNFADSLTGLVNATTGTLKTTLTTLQTTYQTIIYTSCDVGCNTMCGLAHCATCPLALRDRNSCNFTATDPSSCAVAGLVSTLINTNPLAGWQTGP
jgi:hypothetical protein